MPRRIPIEDFFRNPENVSLQVSPDGRKISFLRPYRKRLNIFVHEIDSDVANRVTAETERDVLGYFWKGMRLVFLTDFQGDENFHLTATDSDGGNRRDLTPFPKVKVELIDELRESEHEVLVGLNNRRPEVFDAYRLNIVTGQLQLVGENRGDIVKWVADHKGRLRVAVALRGTESDLLYRDTESDPFETVFTTNFKDDLWPVFFTFDNKNLYAASNIGRDKSAFIILDPKTAKECATVFEHPQVDVESLHYSRKREVLTVASYITWKREFAFLNSDTEAFFTRLSARLPNSEIVIPSCDDSESILIVAAYSDRNPGSYYLYKSKEDALTKLADICPWLDENQLSEVRPIEYTARDGLTIHGYLTLPKDAPPKNFPLLVNPHGGPWYRDQWAFNPEVQMFANRGYAVLQVNFRGSTGYGKKFWQASFKQWGRRMQDDLTDGVDYLVKQGIADPKKICIYGTSYGGYAALAGLAFTPDLYACGIDCVGISNLFTFLEAVPPYWKIGLPALFEMIGNPETDHDLLVEASPIFHVDKIKARLMVAHGANDPRANISESDRIVGALRSKGIDVTYLVKNNDGHGFVIEENRLEFYETMEKFLAQNIGPYFDQ